MKLEENHSQRALGTTVSLSIPIRDQDIFKYGATSEVLGVLTDNPDFSFTISQLTNLNEYSEKATRSAIEVLRTNELVEVHGENQPRRIQINLDRLTQPSDPVRRIPQSEFQAPVKIAQLRLQDELRDIAGMILFGSVARGDADRQSDIDLWVLVTGDLPDQRNRANTVSKELSGLQIPPALAYADYQGKNFEATWDTYNNILNEDSQNWASASRYSFQILVETPQSIIHQQELVEPELLFGQGITLLTTETLDRVKQEVFGRE